MKTQVVKKIGMTELFDETAKFQAVTVLEVSPCVVTQVKCQDVDGYTAIQIGYGSKQQQTKPEAGHARNHGKFRHLREIRVPQDSLGEFAAGQKIQMLGWEVGERINLQGVSKGKGFAGNVKRHNFTTGPKTHGSDNYRKPGSIGACSYPGHILKGKRMAGRMGTDRITLRNLKIVKIIPERNILFVNGSVPGPRGSLAIISSAEK